MNTVGTFASLGRCVIAFRLGIFGIFNAFLKNMSKGYSSCCVGALTALRCFGLTSGEQPTCSNIQRRTPAHTITKFL